MLRFCQNRDDREVAEDHGACGLAGVIDLDNEASNDVIAAVVHAGERMICRTGLSVDDDGKVFGADGAGVLFDTREKGQWMDMLSERQRRSVHDDADLQIGTFHFDRSLTPLDVEATRQAINDCFARRGLKVLDWEDIVTDEEGIDPRRISRIPRYHKITYLTRGVDRQEDATIIYRVARRINNRIRNIKIGSLALDRIVFKGILMGPELAKFFPILAILKAIAAIAHKRYSTNVVTDQEQPFGSLAHNGEINSVAATRKALMNLGVSWNFFDKILVNGGSDSAHLNDALELMLVNDVPLPEALMRLIPPALKKIGHEDMRQLIQASKRAMETFGMWEGPAAVLSIDDTHFAAHMDRLGLRPMRWLEVKSENDGKSKRRLVMSSEVGAVPFDYKDVVRTGVLKGGETLAVKLDSGEVLTGDDLFEHVLRHTGLNWEELNGSKLFVPTQVRSVMTPSALNLNSKEIKRDPELYRKLAAFGWAATAIDSAVERINIGKPIITSMGVHGPLSILDPNLANINDLFLQRAAIITNPPFDPAGESDVIETDVYLGKMPSVEVDRKTYEPIYPQWKLSSPIISSELLHEMQDCSDTVALNNGENHGEAPKMKRIDITFYGNYKSFLGKIAAIKKQVIKLSEAGNGDGTSIIVLSDRNAFNGDQPHKAIPPVLLVQEIMTELVNRGLERNISLVVDSATVRSGHDVGLLIAQGASGVCPWMLEEIAKLADDPKQALHNLHTELNTELVKMMSKQGITTVLGARMGYWFGAVGLAPEVSGSGGAKTVSKVGGMGNKLIYDSLVYSQLRRLNNPDGWMKETSAKEDKAGGAYDLVTREFLNLAAFPNAERIRELIQRDDVLRRDDFPELFGDSELSDDELTDISFNAATVRRLNKLLTLRDALDIQYQHEKITPELLEKAPAISQILSGLKMAHMSLGAHGKVAHGAMVRGCNKLGIESASGEGGEESERSRTGPRPMDRSYARQMGTAGWGVTRQYLCEADEICIKIAQGAKPGEGGDLPGAKVDGFIASIRHVKVGTRLISPPPNHDIYSIEDLLARIRGLRALNPRAKISIKVASMPGLGTIAVGAVKAGVDVLEISGFDAGTGAAGEQSINHCGWPVEIGLAEVHQYLVKAGLRSRVKLVADGKMMTAQDFIKMRLMGADAIGLGTLLMSYVNCIACKNCHTNKCPKGITTQNEEWQRARFVGKEDVMNTALDARDELQIELGSQGVTRGLLALVRDIQKELAKMGITAEDFERMVGDVKRLSQIETGNPVVDSLDLESALMAQVSPPPWQDPDAVTKRIKNSVANVYKNPLGERVLSDCEEFLQDKVDGLELHYDIQNTDREFGVQLSGQIYEQLERFGKLGPDAFVVLNTRGEGGHNYGAWAGNGMIFRHEGFLNDSVGQGMSGNARIIVKAHSDLIEKEDQTLIGNQACMWATGGTLYCPGKAGARLGVRNSGAIIVAEGATDYPFEYMTAGEGYMLGDWAGEIGSRMTGGKIFVYDPEGSRRERISKAYVKTEEMQDADLQDLKEKLEDYFKETGSPKARRILDNWEVEKLNFLKIVPK